MRTSVILTTLPDLVLGWKPPHHKAIRQARAYYTMIDGTQHRVQSTARHGTMSWPRVPIIPNQTISSSWSLWRTSAHEPATSRRPYTAPTCHCLGGRRYYCKLLQIVVGLSTQYHEYAADISAPMQDSGLSQQPRCRTCYLIQWQFALVCLSTRCKLRWNGKLQARTGVRVT